MVPKVKLRILVWIVLDGLIILNDVLFIVDLKTNLISVGQFYDDELIVMFTKSTCKLLKNDGSCVLCHTRSSCFNMKSYVMLQKLTSHACGKKDWETWTICKSYALYSVNFGYNHF